MKTVFNSADCVHTFAQRSQQNGRSSNLFFEGDKIYSYGYHYLLGEFVNDGAAIVINDRGYSNTTAKHISLLRQATRQYRQFFTSYTDDKLFTEKLNSLSKSLANARKPEIYIGEATSLIESRNEYLSFIGRNDSGEIQALKGQFLSEAKVESLIEVMKQRAKQAKEDTAKKEAQDTEKFLTFKTDWARLSFDVVRFDGETFQTSQGLKFDKSECLQMYTALKTPNTNLKGERFKHYTILEHTQNTIKIGCHTFKTEHLLNVGQQVFS